ncbi:MAG: type II toxin-antitoxin system HicB family antitoxin [Candidatus Magasanikbacteria bacterium]|nr:type II toxin-antitoxin system HicB family antitoxin [Candidatus Magasanikbacteria bacterium]
MTLKLTTTYHLEGKFYVAYCAELGVTSQGETLEEAEKNLREAIELYLEDAPAENLARYTEHPLIRTLDLNLA